MYGEMKGKLTIFAAAVLALFGCEKLADNIVTYNGPVELSAEAQIVTYVPTVSAVPTINEVKYWLIQMETEEILGNESKTAAIDGIFEFDFFTISVSGENLVLDISENTTDCYREIAIRVKCEGYDGQELSIRQLPADVHKE